MPSSQVRTREAPTRVEVPFADLDAKARILSVPRVNSERFLTSAELTAARVVVDRKRKMFTLELL